MNKKQILYLSGVLNENEFHEGSDHELKHYMFFSNLKVIKEKIDAMLKLDPKKIDAELSDGHDWAGDHITSSRDDIEEVYNWIMTRVKPG